MITSKSIQAALTNAAHFGIFHLILDTVPTNGVTGVGIAGKGCLLTNHNTGALYKNTGSSDNPVWVELT